MYLPPIITLISVDHLAMGYCQFPPSFAFDDSIIQKMLQDILMYSRFTVIRTEHLSNHLHRICLVHLSNGSQVALKLSPSPSTDLLRHERNSLETEASVLTFLMNSNLPVPRALRYDRNGMRLESPFLLTTHLPGIAYADALPYLTRTERREIELRLRTFRSTVSQRVSHQFGPVALVASGRGFSSWREAFRSMIESVLMDGEDRNVHIPYIEIREAFSKWGKALDEVREARLVVMALGRPENVLIDRKTNNITGLLDFGQATWGDPALSEPETCPGTKGLL